MIAIHDRYFIIEGFYYREAQTTLDFFTGRNYRWESRNTCSGGGGGGGGLTVAPLPLSVWMVVGQLPFLDGGVHVGLLLEYPVGHPTDGEAQGHNVQAEQPESRVEEVPPGSVHGVKSGHRRVEDGRGSLPGVVPGIVRRLDVLHLQRPPDRLTFPLQHGLVRRSATPD